MNETNFPQGRSATDPTTDLQTEAAPSPAQAVQEEAESAGTDFPEGAGSLAPAGDAPRTEQSETSSESGDTARNEDLGVAPQVEEASEPAPEAVWPASEAEPTPEPELSPDSAPEPEAEAAPEPEPEAEAAPEPEPEAEAAPEPEAVGAFEGPGDWYVVHTYAGYENKVKANLHSRIGSMQMEDKIFDVVIPMEDVMEIKGGKKQVVQKKVFPGYLLVKMIYDNDSWYVVRNTPGVTGFVSSGTGTKPTPLSNREVEKILAVKKETQKKPEYRLEWDEGDTVRIIAGPFADFVGTVAEINVEQSKLKVLVNIFDRETPVELAFDQVSKA